MPSTVESLLLRLKIDNSLVKSGLVSAESSIKKFASNTRNYLKESFTNSIKTFLPAITAGGLLIEFNKIRNSIEDLGAQAKQLGVNPEFIQDLRNVSEAAGVAPEKLANAFGKFTMSLEEGADVKEEILKAADALAAIKDPVERNRIAFDMFGKSYTDVLRVIGDGRAEFQKNADEFSKFTQQDIDAIEKLDNALDRSSKNIQIWLGHIIGDRLAANRGFQEIAKGSSNIIQKWAFLLVSSRSDTLKLGQELLAQEKRVVTEQEKSLRVSEKKAKEQEKVVKQEEEYAKLVQQADDILFERDQSNLSLEEQKNRLLEKRLEITNRILDNEFDLVEEAKKYVEIAKIDKEVNKLTADEVKRQKEEAEKELRFKATLLGVDIARKKEQKEITEAVVRSLHDTNAKYQPTIEELAQGGRGWQYQDARRIQFLEKDTKMAFAKGNFDYAQENIKEIQSLTKGLQDSGFIAKDLDQEIADATLSTAQQLEALTKQQATIKVQLAEPE